VLKLIVRAALIAKRTITIAALFAAPFALMAQPSPFAEAADTATNVPSWTAELADRFPACEEQREGVLAAAVVVVDSGADVHRMSVDQAYALNTDDERANNVWVVGACR
jgi:hypothetical protein